MQIQNIRNLIKKIFNTKDISSDINSLLEDSEKAINEYLYNKDKEENSNQINELSDEILNTDEEPVISTSNLKNNLNEIYWRTCFRILEQKTKNTLLTELSFLKEEKLFFNFGFIDERLFNDEETEKIVLSQKEYKFKDIGYNILFFTDFLSKKYMQFMQIDNLNKLKEKQNKMQTEFINKRNGIEHLKKARKSMLSSALRREEILYLMETLDSLIVKEFELTKKIKEGFETSSEERKEIADCKIKKEKFTRDQILLMADLTKVGANESIDKLDQKIKKELIEIINFKYGLQEIENEIKNVCVNQNTNLLCLRVNAMSKFLLKIKAMGQICARRGQASFSCVFFKKQNFFTTDKIKNILDFIEEFDIKIFRSHKKPRPDVLIIPGIGNGLYDWEENMLIIPFIPIRSYEESLAAAIISYKLDIDEEKAITTSLKELLKYKAIVSLIAFNKQLTKDYITWITKESKGYLVLDKETRKWFMLNIGPKIRDYKIPFLIKQRLQKGEDREELIKEYDNLLIKEIDLAKNNLYMGILYILKEEKEKAIEYLNKTLSLDSNLHDAIYNLALLYEETHSLKQAILMWQNYIVNADNSWWTILAKQHLKKLKNR